MSNRIIFFVFALFLFGIQKAFSCSSDQQQVYLDEQWRFSEAIYDASASAKDPAVLKKAIRLSDCAQSRLSAEQKLQLYKDNYSELYRTDVYPFGERKAYLEKMLQDSGPAGKQYVSAVEIAFSKTTPDDVRYLTLSNMSGIDANRIAFELVQGSRVSGIDSEKIQAWAIDFIKEPTDMIKLLSSIGFRANMPLLDNHILSVVQNLTVSDLNPTLTCELIVGGLLNLSPINPNGETEALFKIKSELLKKIISLTEKPRFEDKDCHGAKMSKYRTWFLQSYEENGKRFRSGQKPASSPLVPPKVLPKGVSCKLDEVRKWLGDVIKYNYEWPLTLLAGESLNQSCQVNLRVFSETVRVYSSGKKATVEKQSRYRVEVIDPQNQKVAIGTVRVDLLAGDVDAKVTEWKVFDAPQLKLNGSLKPDASKPAGETQR